MRSLSLFFCSCFKSWSCFLLRLAKITAALRKNSISLPLWRHLMYLPIKRDSWYVLKTIFWAVYYKLVLSNFPRDSSLSSIYFIITCLSTCFLKNYPYASKLMHISTILLPNSISFSFLTAFNCYVVLRDWVYIDDKPYKTVPIFYGGSWKLLIF